MGTSVAEPGTRTSYKVKAMSLEACSCAHGCNCQFGGFPNEGMCDFLIGFEVRNGKFGDVDLNGLKFVVAAKYPGAIHEGNGHVALFVDEKATSQQVNAIATICSGGQGGMPWEAIAATVTKLEGPIQKPIEMSLDGPRSSFSIADVLECRATPLTDPVTGEEKEVHIVYPKGGFFWNDGNVVTTTTMKISWSGLRFEYPAKYASVAEVNWTNQA
ncbi:MAG: DUF1326 domain-containing protein [Gemmatimonadota bacterium]|nr:DUF1326 domain-containing protein [Gemmatimonadota bacterium]